MILSGHLIKSTFLFTILLVSVQVKAQNKEYESALKLFKLKEYSVVTGEGKGRDTVYFLATIPNKKKKTIVFCSGSGPTPLIIKMPEGMYPAYFPAEIDSNTRKEFNMVFISKPGLKIFATKEDMNADLMKHGQFLQLDSMNRPPKKYTINNSLHKLGNDCIAVIRFLKKQQWVDGDNIYVFGHSQGAVVAAYVACKDPNDLKGIIYSQGNAYGIHAGYLSSIIYSQATINDVNRKMDSVYLLHSHLVGGVPDKEMDEIYGWKEADLFDRKNNDFYDVATSRWRSLEEPMAIDYLLKINKPILLVQGLNSPGDMDNKNIPLDFARHHKHNLTSRFYPGYDHNFFKQVTDEKGNEQEPEFHWNEVFGDVKKWINGLEIDNR